MKNDNDISERKFQKELNAGTSALILLAILSRANKPMYGYQIAKTINVRVDESPIKLGAMYPVLRSLEAGGLLESQVEPSVSGPPRRYYRITDAGREMLIKWAGIWNRTKALVNECLEGDGNV